MVYTKSNRCCKLVKQHFTNSKHKKCTSVLRKRPPFTMNGAFLNKYCPSSLSPFNDDEEYQMCYNLKQQFDRNRIDIPPPPPPPIIPIPESPAVFIPPIKHPIASTRDERVLVNNARRTEDDYKRCIEDLHAQNHDLKEALNDIYNHIIDGEDEDCDSTAVNDNTPKKKKRKYSV